jgi:hypothetical protein
VLSRRHRFFYPGTPTQVSNKAEAKQSIPLNLNQILINKLNQKLIIFPKKEKREREREIIHTKEKMTRISPLSFLSLLLGATTTTLLPQGVQAVNNAPDQFKGTGLIYVFNNTDFETIDPAAPDGCLNARGLLTLDDCAVFLRKEGTASAPGGSLSTLAGRCSFRNRSMPENVESVYGKGSFAWRCGEGGIGGIGGGEEESESYYTMVSSFSFFFFLFSSG